MTNGSGSIGAEDGETDPVEVLRAAARLGDEPLEIAETALAFAAMDRPGVPLGRYRRELDAMVEAVASRVASLSASQPAEEKVACLSRALAGEYSFKGDEATYDDPQNANLMRVIDRRKGLPVTLGILYMHAARRQGWWAEGLNFPNHFLIRVRIGSDQVILDPFHEGRTMDAPALRSLIRDMSGGKADLSPAATQAVSDRQVLLRLQNNIKLRLYRNNRFAEALKVLERMRLLAPDLTDFQREAGMVNARLGNLSAAIGLLRDYLENGDAGDTVRHETARVLMDLEKQLN
jgi:regulator of sirC expression with transglutaminase-like and TPR domain